MKLSVYTFARNGLRNDYHLLHMVRHHLPFADEIVIHEGLSTDGTFEALDALAKTEPKVKLFRSDWDQFKGMEFCKNFKDEARKRCTGDWCVLLDADELLPEWEWEPLRKAMSTTDRVTLGMTLTNFYGNYRVYCAEPKKFRWPWMKVNVHRNVPGIQMWGGDASSVKADGEEFEMVAERAVCDLHHFGYVRKPARLREAWRNMRGLLYNAPPPRFKLPSWLFNLFPHNWLDADFLPALALYEGKHTQTVLNDPAEFTRDGMKLYEHLKARRAT